MVRGTTPPTRTPSSILWGGGGGSLHKQDKLKEINTCPSPILTVMGVGCEGGGGVQYSIVPFSTGFDSAKSFNLKK